MEDITTTPWLVAVTVVVGTVLVGSFSWLRSRLETKVPFADLPMVPDSHWLLGHFKLLLAADFRHLYTVCKASANEHGQVSLWMGRRRGVFVFDLEDCLLVLNREQQRLRPALIRWHSDKFVGPSGLLGLNGRQWRLHRAAVSRTFNPDFLSAARKDMKTMAERMVDSFRKTIEKDGEKGGVQVDVEPAMKAITLDVFGTTSLDTDLGCTSSTTSVSPMVQAFEYILRQFMVRLQNPLWPQHFFYWLPTEQNRRQHKERQLIRNFLADLIHKKRQAILESSPRSSFNTAAATEKDLLSHLLRSHAEIQKSSGSDAEAVSDESLTDVVMTNFVAGYDTTSIALGFALYLLAQHPQAQEECAQEASKSDCVDPNELVYCKAVIWEALRLFPPAVRTNRTLRKPLELSGGFVVPEGTEVWIPIYDIHYNETYFPSPKSFRPDRWAAKQTKTGMWVERDDEDPTLTSSTDDGTTIAAGNHRAMLAFSAGARNCVGYKFALQEATIVLANLVKDIEFRPVPGFQLTTNTKALLHKPDNGVPLLLSIRSN